ncbi:MAG TPA: hypothetical protein ENK82_07845, partial [Campylobacterales bacterium]|nr:hypothetical protein [Campylobacterales bacterium]
MNNKLSSKKELNMLDSIVHIESSDKNNRSFGTGFAIDTDDYGAYILTCQHVIEKVETPRVENQEVEIISSSDFWDMAVIYVKDLHVQPLRLQIEPCKSNEVEAIGFSSFSNELVQKKVIKGRLFENTIQLHSKVDDSFYLVRRIKTEDDYSFDQGNSGSPLICKKSGSVIGMISNRDRSDIAYAIEIGSLKEIWKDLNTTLINQGTLHSHQHFYANIKTFTSKFKERLDERKKEIHTNTKAYVNNMQELQQELEKLKENIETKSKFKYFFLGIGTIVSLIIAYYILTLPQEYEPENYKVVHIPAGDVLNIREGKGSVYPILGVIPAEANNVAVTLCESNDAGKEWCKVTYGSVIGWVHSNYIEKEERVYTDVNRENKSAFSATNDKLFLHFTYPPSVKPGEKILISAQLENRGNPETQGGVTLSFPQRPILNYTIDYNDFDHFKHYKIFDTIYNNHPNQDKKMHAIHPSLEAFSEQWASRNKHVFALSIIAPKDLNVLRIRVRGYLTLKRLV